MLIFCSELLLAMVVVAILLVFCVYNFCLLQAQLRSPVLTASGLVAAAILDFNIGEIRNFICWRCRITVPNFVKITRSLAEILQGFKFLKWPSLPSWIFEIVKFYWLTLRCPKCRDASPLQIWSKLVWKYFNFFIFQHSGRRHIGFSISQNFYWRAQWLWPSHITVPNIVKIGPSVAEILRFFEFSRWPPPSWISEIAKFYILTGFRGSRPISMPNFMKISQ